MQPSFHYYHSHHDAHPTPYEVHSPSSHCSILHPCFHIVVGTYSSRVCSIDRRSESYNHQSFGCHNAMILVAQIELGSLSSESCVFIIVW